MRLFFNGTIINRFPFTMPNGMRVLRFDRPSFAWPSGKVILNNGTENFVAAPPAVGLSVGDA